MVMHMCQREYLGQFLLSFWQVVHIQWAHVWGLMGACMIFSQWAELMEEAGYMIEQVG